MNNENDENSYENLRLKKILEKSAGVLSGEDIDANLKNDHIYNLRKVDSKIKENVPNDVNCVQNSNFMSIGGNSKNPLNEIHNTNSNINGTNQNQATGQSNFLYGGQPIMIA